MGPREPLRAITNKPATCAAPNKLSVGTLSSSERENRSDFFGNKAERPKECEAQSRDSYGRHHYHHHHSSQRDQRVDQMPEKACVLERCYAANDSADGENVDHGSTSPTIDRETNNNAVRWSRTGLYMMRIKRLSLLLEKKKLYVILVGFGYQTPRYAQWEVDPILFHCLDSRFLLSCSFLFQCKQK